MQAEAEAEAEAAVGNLQTRQDAARKNAGRMLIASCYKQALLSPPTNLSEALAVLATLTALVTIL